MQQDTSKIPRKVIRQKSIKRESICGAPLMGAYPLPLWLPQCDLHQAPHNLQAEP